MKTTLLALLAFAFILGTGVEASAQCSSANYCGSYFSSWDLTDAYILTDDNGDILFGPTNCGQPWTTTGGRIRTGDAIIFMVEECQTYTWSMCGLPGNNFDAVMSLWSNSAVPQILCFNDDNCTFAGPSEITWKATFTGSVVLTVNNFYCDNLESPFDLTMTSTCGDPCLPNDACMDAITICCTPSGACPNTVIGTTIGATYDNVGFCGTNNSGPGAWYMVTATEDGTMEATTCTQYTNFDTKISVFEGTCPMLTCVGGNDDDMTLPCTNFQSRVRWCATAGTNYYILVHGFSSATGDFGLTLNCAPTPSTNDDIADATSLTLTCGGNDSDEFDNICATPDGPSPGEAQEGPYPTCVGTDGWCNFGTGVENDLWWCFVAPNAAGEVIVMAQGEEDFDTQLAVWRSGGSAPDATDCGTVGGDGSSSSKSKSSKSSSSKSKSSKSSSSKSKSSKSKSTKSSSSKSKSSKSSKKSSGSADATGGTLANNCNCTPDLTLMTEVGANDDGGLGFGSRVILRIPEDLNPGEKYWIQVDGFSGATGQGTLSIEHKPDNCIDCADAGLTEATVTVQTDQWGGETSWEFNDLDLGEQLGSAQGLASSAQNVSKFCVPNNHCFEFIIYDSFGDGLCGCYDQGYYGVSIVGGDEVGPVCWNGNGYCFSSGAASASHTLSGGLANCDGKTLEVAATAEIEMVAYPNPIQDWATLEYTVSTSDMVSVDLIGLSGENITNIYGGYADAGSSYKINLDATNFQSGIYFVQVSTSSEVAREKIVIIK